MRPSASRGLRLGPVLALVASAIAILAGCGHTVTMYGSADDVWGDTVEVLRRQRMIPHPMPANVERPRLDRPAGEIDLPYASSVYYGDGAAFIQVDVSEPFESRARTVRLWVDYPVGNQVVRYGRALDERASDTFRRSFENELRLLLAEREAEVDRTSRGTQLPVPPPDRPTAPPAGSMP